jgi:hypothetical protein
MLCLGGSGIEGTAVAYIAELGERGSISECAVAE